jgi:hypothetical protein
MLEVRRASLSFRLTVADSFSSAANTTLHLLFLVLTQLFSFRLTLPSPQTAGLLFLTLTTPVVRPFFCSSSRSPSRCSPSFFSFVSRCFLPLRSRLRIMNTPTHLVPPHALPIHTQAARFHIFRVELSARERARREEKKRSRCGKEKGTTEGRLREGNARC